MTTVSAMQSLRGYATRNNQL